jgi:hypothetical protein
MQFKELLGKNSDGTEKLGTPLTEQKVVRIMRDPNKNEKVEYADDLNKEEKAIKNQFSRNEMSNPTNDAWVLTVNGEKYSSGVDRDESTQQDKIATKNFHLVNTLKSSFNNATFFYADPSTGKGSLLPKDAAVAIDKKVKEFFDLPGKVKEDGGIKSINITLAYYVPSTVDDKSFEALKKAFGEVDSLVKDMYMKSGVKNVAVKPVIERRSDSQQANANTPDIQITLKR